MFYWAKLVLVVVLYIRVGYCASAQGWQPDGYHVFPGGSIQEGLEQAARSPTNKTVKVHAGIYRPMRRGQASVWFNRSHSGIKLEAVGEVTLTAANAGLFDNGNEGHPAVVNHVVYFGDGVSGETVLEGFRITGANHFVTTKPPEVEPSTGLKKNLFFYADGGAVKIFGCSCPTLRQLEIVDNYASPCAGGISVQQQQGAEGIRPGPVKIANCIFRRNRSQITGAAVDLLPGSCAVISNCLFVGNVANQGVNYIAENQAQPEFTNSAPLTVFPTSRAVVEWCTFTGNRNGVEDLGGQSVYRNCIFSGNNLGEAFYAGERYDLDIEGHAEVSGCVFGGRVVDPQHVISKTNNDFSGAAPQFDSQFKPGAPEYKKAGFRPHLVNNEGDKK